MSDPSSAPANAVSDLPEDLRAEVEKRKLWFFECQLRFLNLDSMRGVTQAMHDPRLDLISEPVPSWAFPGPIGGRLIDLGPVYLDSQEKVWTQDENARRDRDWAEKFIGRIDNWLGYKSGKRLAAAVAETKALYEQSTYASQIDLAPALNHLRRRTPNRQGPNDPGDGNSMGRAISRAMLAQAKPWLIPELYNAKHPDTTKIENWVGNLEKFIADFEIELGIALGGIALQTSPLATLEGAAYRATIKTMLDMAPMRDAANALKSQMLTKTGIPNFYTYHYDIQLQTSGYPMGPIGGFPFSDSVKYWTDVFHSSLGEVYVNKPNADMGLCHIMRTVYLLGTLPAALGKDDELHWRQRAAPGADFAAFFSKKADDPALEGDPALRSRLLTAQDKLQVILEETALHRRCAAPMFSPLAQEIVRQALHSFKFWLDEPLHVSSNATLVQARADTKIVTNDKEQKAEMEYWSENHYIMFASSEFLAGQLWAADEFQPGKEFLAQDSKSGILSGKDRMARGKARVLKWLNNRLQFGWMEFNSSGYYREHLWALLNLADFSLDQEVRDKATLAIDLMLFDVARFLHKGTMGAAGGRSQFKSKSSGWDNALCDVVEILFAPRGIFSDGDGQIGSSLATSAYRVPEVLLEIGIHPPAMPFTDRTRVSVTFDEAPKYGIGYSRDSDQKDSLMQGYAAKRARHFPFVDSVNQELARTHSNYGGTEDDTIFWWGTSAFFNKQIVRNTFAAMKTFGLDQSGVFGGKIPTLIRIVSGYEKLKHAAIGGLIGSIAGPVGAVVGTALGFFEDDIFDASTLEAASDDLSVLIEGSTRTRANILSYRSPDVMLSSIQNFRAGQLNFQSSVSQASVHPSLNIFTTAGVADINVSNLAAGLGGGLLGGAIGAAFGGPVLGVLGAALAIVGDELLLTNTDLGFIDHDDGPGWWTGSWALPMAVQHGSAVILAYDFHTIQETLADCGSHAWFPKQGFDRVDEMRTSAYDDANFALLDITHIGRKGFWLFGKFVHPAIGKNEPGEAYVGVFSNQRPKWLDKDSDVYKQVIQETVKTPIDKAKKEVDSVLDDLEDSTFGGIGRSTVKAVVQQALDSSYMPDIATDVWLEAAKALLAKVTDIVVATQLDKANQLAEKTIALRNLQRIFADPLPQDYFAGRDWHADGKNIWIVQVGSRIEFGDFHNFKERVSSARVHLDDSGDLECSYDIPLGNGGSERLTLAYGDGGRFGLNGQLFGTDLYPRFENPFIRGGRVEWGQREYVIEYNGKSLLHDFSDYSQPARGEAATATAEERNLVKALVIFVRTGDEDMDAFTVAKADVGIGCSRATHEQVVAAGPVDDNSDHDAEWIFFDFPIARDANMTLSLTHPASTKGDDTPHWKMSFRLFALMGDRVLRPCSLSYAYFEFVDHKRTAPQFPFSIALFEWRPWVNIPNHKSPVFWTLAKQPEFAKVFYDYSDLLAIDTAGRLWHRRLMSCAAAETGWFAVTQAGSDADEPDLAHGFFVAAASAQPATLYLAIQSQATLFARQPTPAGNWSEPWKRIDVWTYPDAIFGIPDTSGAPVPVTLSPLSPVAALPSADVWGAVELTVLGADGHFYSRVTHGRDDLSPWRKIDVSGFAPLFGAPFEVTADFVFALASDRSLWAAEVDHSGNHITPVWGKVSADDFAVSRFTVTQLQDACQIVAVTMAAGVRAATYHRGEPRGWAVVNLPGTSAALDVPLASAAPTAERAMFFVAGADGKVYVLDRQSSAGWTPGSSWSEIAPDGGGIAAQTAAGVAAISRLAGEVEVFAQGTDGALAKAWWS